VPPVVGVLALQGDFEAHAQLLRSLGAEPREVRVPAELDALDGLIIPGGESTVMALGIEREGLAEPLRDLHAREVPIDREHLGLMDVRARRNAFGRQLSSFECDLEVVGLNSEPMRAVFIRAPWIEERGPGVEVLAEVEGHPVAARDGTLLAVAFHPELTGDARLHELFLASLP
jgi:5'-phosphate synthase pdxT subunit